MDAYIKKHWNGEFTLARSYWLNSVIISNVAIIIAAFCVGLVWGVLTSGLGIAKPGEQFWNLVGYIVSIPFVIWSVGGTWRAADKYKVENSGVFNWGTVAQVCLSIGVIKFVLTLLMMFR